MNYDSDDDDRQMLAVFADLGDVGAQQILRERTKRTLMADELLARSLAEMESKKNTKKTKGVIFSSDMSRSVETCEYKGVRKRCLDPKVLGTPFCANHSLQKAFKLQWVQVTNDPDVLTFFETFCVDKVDVSKTTLETLAPEQQSNAVTLATLFQHEKKIDSIEVSPVCPILVFDKTVDSPVESVEDGQLSSSEDTKNDKRQLLKRKRKRQLKRNFGDRNVELCVCKTCKNAELDVS